MQQVKEFYEAYGVKFDANAVPDDSGWLMGHCPLLPLGDPNMTINVKNGRWNCKEIEGKGTKTEWQRVYGRSCDDKTDAKALDLQHLSQIDDPALYGQRVRLRIAVIGEMGDTYHSVHSFRVKHCTGLTGKRKRGRECDVCRTKAFNVPLWHAGHIGACNTKEADVHVMLRKFCCPYNARPILEVETRGSLREIYCQDAADRLVERSVDDVAQKRVFAHIAPEKPMALRPRSYVAEGWIVTHPKTCQTTLLIDVLEEHKERHEVFRYQDALPELEAMKAIGVEKLLAYVGKHITHLTEADQLLMLVWLTYCSPLWINFNGERIRGWLNVACIGDSGTGKSIAFERISEWLGIGDIFSALTGRRTGLAYSIQIGTGNRRARVQWGVCPRSSGKILCVEEAQVLPQMDIQALSIAMDTGKLKVDMVASGNCQCATRLVFLGNPPHGKTLSHYPMGCMAARELFFPMFLRRLDVALFLRRHDEEGVYNKAYTSTEHELVTPEMASALVFFAWSLTEDRLRFEKGATAAILKESERLGKRFGQSDDLPLVAPADFRKTLARLAAAFAVLSLAGDERFHIISVTDGHVAVMVDFLERIYASPSALLHQYSDMMVRRQGMVDYEVVKASILRMLRSHADTGDAFAATCPFAKLLGLLLSDGPFALRDLNDVFGGEAVKAMLGIVTRHNLVEMDSSGVFMAPKGVKFFERFFDECPDWHALVHTDEIEQE